MLFKSIGDSLREGLNALSSGNSEMAVQALGYAAREGNVAAQWKLGRMYQDGEGVRRATTSRPTSTSPRSRTATPM